MAANPAFAATPRNGVVQISTANANRDGSGTVGTVFTAGANGSRIDKVTAKAQTTTTAGMIRLFVHNGTSYFLAYEMTVDAITPSATLAGWTETAPVTETGGANDIFPLILPNGYSLRASTEKGETFNIHAQGGDF
jgi:hypothetical protein